MYPESVFVQNRGMIKAESISRAFGTLKAVRNISFSAEAGKIFGIIGPNGAGKSTTIRMVMGIYAPDSGRILFNGREMGGEDRDRFGYLPEERGLYRKVRVRDMLRYLGELKTASRSDCDRRIDSYLKRFDLADAADKRTNELSKGMAQKVQFIGAVIHDPEVIILDEPFSGLDPVSVETLRNAILELREAGKSIFFSTHVMEQAEQLCDYIFLINKGEGVLEGTLPEIRSRFGSRRVRVEFRSDSIPEAPGVYKVLRHYPDGYDLELPEGMDPDRVLQEMAGIGGIRRWEVASPSLHSIFLSQVGGDIDEA
jgi:ABC-2 type transport system ATP-binding protein